MVTFQLMSTDLTQWSPKSSLATHVVVDLTTGIDIIGMNRDTPIPQQLDKFWSSEENKRNLQMVRGGVQSSLSQSYYYC